MDKQLSDAIILIAVVAASRILSYFEHKRSEKRGKERGVKLDNVILMLNGEVQKKIDEAYQKGKQDQINIEKGL